MNDSQRLQDVIELGQRFAPGYRTKQKSASRAQRSLGWLFAKIGNPGFFHDFWTTSPNFDGSSTTYRPAKTDPGPTPFECGVIAHEVLHAQQARRQRASKLGQWWAAVRHSVAYTFPQCLGLLGAALLPVWLVAFGWVGLLGLIPLVALAPLPAPWRVEKEFEAYCVSLAMDFWHLGGFDAATEEHKLDWAVGYFTGPAYYWMSRNPAKMRARFGAWIEALRAEAPETKTEYLLALRELVERYRAEET